jgi:hypothetical protein
MPVTIKITAKQLAENSLRSPGYAVNLWTETRGGLKFIGEATGIAFCVRASGRVDWNNVDLIISGHRSTFDANTSLIISD